MEITDKQKHDTITYIKEHIKEKGNCRVGHALKETVGEKFENSIHNIEKIANTVIESGKYLKEDSKQKPSDINIRKNPDYSLKQFNKGTVIFNIILALINVSFVIYHFMKSIQI